MRYLYFQSGQLFQKLDQAKDTIRPMAADRPSAAEMKKRAREAWEPESFRHLYRRSASFNYVKHVEEEPDNMNKVITKVNAKTEQLTSTWQSQPTRLEADALKLIAFLIMDHREWNLQNDMVTTMIVGMSPLHHKFIVLAYIRRHNALADANQLEHIGEGRPHRRVARRNAVKKKPSGKYPCTTGKITKKPASRVRSR